MAEEVTHHSEELDRILGELANDYFDRLARGEDVAISEYADRFPEYAVDIKKVLPALERFADSFAGDSDHPHPLDAHLLDLRPRRQLGDFRIIRELGRGGMGIVYEAQQISMGDRPVALKVLPFATIVDDKQLQRFRNEGIFYEGVTNRIMDDFLAVVKPRRATVESRWTPRGGLHSNIVVKFPDEG